MQDFSIAIFVATPILFIAALAVRFAGSTKILNIIDYSTVPDPNALHVWAGNRLLLLAFCTASLAAASLLIPAYSFIFLISFIAITFSTVFWLAIGSSKFSCVRSN